MSPAYLKKMSLSNLLQTSIKNKADITLKKKPPPLMRMAAFDKVDGFSSSVCYFITTLPVLIVPSS